MASVCHLLTTALVVVVIDCAAAFDGSPAIVLVAAATNGDNGGMVVMASNAAAQLTTMTAFPFWGKTHCALNLRHIVMLSHERLRERLQLKLNIVLTH
jgi:hypothetical protein